MASPERKSAPQKIQDATLARGGVIIEEMQFNNPSQRLLKELMHRHSSLGKRIIVGEIFDRKGCVVGSITIEPQQINTPEDREDAVYALLQVNSVKVQEIIFF